LIDGYCHLWVERYHGSCREKGNELRKELLMEALNNRLFFELTLAFISYFITWLVDLILGLRILKITINPKKILPGALIGCLFSFFVKPYLPMSTAIFLPIALLILFIKAYGKEDLIKSAWAGFLVFLIIILGTVFIISPLCLNKEIAFFFLNTQYGNTLGTVAEVLFPIIVLIIMSKNPKISLIPPFLTKKFDVIAVVTLGATFYFIFCQSLRLLESLESNSNQKIEHFLYEWLATLTAVAGYYTLYKKAKKENNRLEYENEKLIELHAVITEKDQQIMELFEALRTLLKDQGSRDAIPDEANKPELNITEREIKFIKYLEKGLTYKEIAAIEVLSLSRVGDIIATIKKKLNATSQAQIPIIAMKNKII
jgi:DNA-binding CsgD family transcriptional regulator